MARSAATPNVLVYATSNRRHLLPEYMTDNLAQQRARTARSTPARWWKKISLSERFGLWVSFYPFSQDEYLRVVAQWLSALGMGQDRGGPARSPGLGAGARLAQRPRGPPVRARLGRRAQRAVEGRQRIADVDGLAEEADRLKPAAWGRRERLLL
jgi:hypothetical protein